MDSPASIASIDSSFDPVHPEAPERKRSRRLAGLTVESARVRRSYAPGFADVYNTRCLDFGYPRHERYPGFWFCNNCRLYEAALMCGTGGRLNPDGKRHHCQAQHEEKSMFLTATCQPVAATSKEDDDSTAVPGLERDDDSSEYGLPPSL